MPSDYQIRYTKNNYKYQLDQDYTHTLPKEYSAHCFFSDYFTLADCSLVIKKGYAWDGPSGPTIDTDNFMRGSLVHDVLYQAMQAGHISPRYKESADKELVRICKQDGMTSLRAWWVCKGVKVGGGKWVKLRKKKVYTSPKKIRFSKWSQSKT